MGGGRRSPDFSTQLPMFAHTSPSPPFVSAVLMINLGPWVLPLDSTLKPSKTCFPSPSFSLARFQIEGPMSCQHSLENWSHKAAPLALLPWCSTCSGSSFSWVFKGTDCLVSVFLLTFGKNFLVAFIEGPSPSLPFLTLSPEFLN